MPDLSSIFSMTTENPSELVKSLGLVEAAEAEASGRIGAAKYNYLASLNRAAGGPVEKDQPYIVGEKGPEVVVPKQDGTVIPNQSLKDLVPAGRGRETGTWEDVGGGLQATSGPGTYNRPAHREVVGAETGPVHVLRGLRSTYAGGAPGERYVSLQRAAQAVRQATGQEKWVPPEQEMEVLKHQNRLAEIAATGKAQETAFGLATQARKGATDYLRQMLLEGHGVADPKDPNAPKTLSPYARDALLKVLPQVKNLEDVPKILAQLEPQLQAGKQTELFNNPATREAARAKVLNVYRQDQAAKGAPADPNIEALILKGQVTPANVGLFNQAYNRGQVPAQPGKAAPQPVSLRSLVPRQKEKAVPMELQSAGALAAPEEPSAVAPITSLVDLVRNRGSQYQQKYFPRKPASAM